MDRRRTQGHRQRDIVRRHPEVVQLFGPYPLSALGIVVLVVTQWTLAWLLHEQPWFVILFVAYSGGAFFNHALYVLMHEATHNLIFASKVSNKVAGLVCDFALVAPGAVSFRKYHLLHHQHLNHKVMDPDVVSSMESRLVGNSAMRKALWISLLSVSQALRPLKTRGQHFIDGWIFANLALQWSVNYVLWYFTGWAGLMYLFLSTFFALGLHPLGGRWIGEHYHVTGPKQETYSYYGPLNRLMFNMGYHTEHHDFPMVAWRRLPKVSRLVPEVYRSLFAHQSYLRLITKFIFDKRITTASRCIH